MNTNEVYLCHIYIKEEIENEDKYNNIFIKKSLVTREYIGVYKDIETEEIYHSYSAIKAPIDNEYVNLKYGIISVSNILNTNKKNMSKKKILSKFKEVNNEDKQIN